MSSSRSSASTFTRFLLLDGRWASDECRTCVVERREHLEGERLDERVAERGGLDRADPDRSPGLTSQRVEQQRRTSAAPEDPHWTIAVDTGKRCDHLGGLVPTAAR